MTHFVEELISFMETGKTQFDQIVGALGVIDTYRLRVICTAILGWMKSQHYHGRMKPLSINPDHQWVQELKNLMLQFGSFNDLLQISGTHLRFNSQIDESTQKQICETAHRLYHPPLMT